MIPRERTGNDHNRSLPRLEYSQGGRFLLLLVPLFCRCFDEEQVLKKKTISAS